MTKVQTLILEINNLELKELELILREILRRIDRRKRLEAALDSLIGCGEGVWNSDAQEYVNGLRDDDRF